MDPSDSLIGRIWMCYRTLMQMLEDRGYQIEWERDTPSFSSLETQLRALDMADMEKAQRLLNQLRRTIEAHPITRNQVEIFWLCGKVGKNSEVVKDIATSLQQHSNVSAIVVQVEGCAISGFALGGMEAGGDGEPKVEVIESEFLLQNIMKAQLQPQFRVLTETEAQAIQKAYCASPDQLPILRWNDPVRRYLGLKEGQVVHIKRFCETGYEIYYRIVESKQVGKKKNK